MHWWTVSVLTPTRFGSKRVDRDWPTARTLPLVPHFIRGKRPSGVLRMSIIIGLLINQGPSSPGAPGSNFCGSGWETHFARYDEACLYLRSAEIGTSDQRNHCRGRDRRCGSPHYPLLVRARRSVDRSDDRTSLRRFKVFPSLAGSRFSTTPCLGHSLDLAT